MLCPSFHRGAVVEKSMAIFLLKTQLQKCRPTVPSSSVHLTLTFQPQPEPSPHGVLVHTASPGRNQGIPSCPCPPWRWTTCSALLKTPAGVETLPDTLAASKS